MKIALTRTESDDKHPNYVKWLMNNEDIEVITFSVDKNNTDDIATCDALVLSGGVDIHPVFYGGSLQYPHKPKNGWKKERDLFEKNLFTSALDHSIPVLGICRGLQLINIALDGTLVQDLGDELNKIHEGSPDKSHLAQIKKDTILHAIVGTEKTEINSAHHQAIDKLGKGLVINARSIDGVVEGVEWKDPSGKSFLLAIQWHPERMFRFQLENSPAAKAIRDRFMEEIKKSIAKKKANNKKQITKK
jgi:putative glutamine amidotransferase